MTLSFIVPMVLLVFGAFLWVMVAEKKEDKEIDLALIESLEYLEEHDCDKWKQRLETTFYKDEISDLSDFDRVDTCSFYLSTDKKIRGLSMGFDEAIDNRDVYFIEIEISGIKPIFHVKFLKYLKGSGGTRLEVSDKAFLHQHEEYLDSLDIFARAHGLVRLRDLELRKLVEDDEGQCTLYYKYFNNFSERLELPWEMD